MAFTRSSKIVVSDFFGSEVYRAWYTTRTDDVLDVLLEISGDSFDLGTLVCSS